MNSGTIWCRKPVSLVALAAAAASLADEVSGTEFQSFSVARVLEGERVYVRLFEIEQAAAQYDPAPEELSRRGVADLESVIGVLVEYKAQQLLRDVLACFLQLPGLRPLFVEMGEAMFPAADVLEMAAASPSGKHIRAILDGEIGPEQWRDLPREPPVPPVPSWWGRFYWRPL